MHDIKWIREEPQGLMRALTRRGMPESEAQALVGGLIALDESRRQLITEVQKAQQDRNAISKAIGAAKAAKDEARAQELLHEAGITQALSNASEKRVADLEKELRDALAAIPNVPLDIVPDGADEHDNVEIDRVGAPRSYAFTPKQHFEIGEALGQMDFEAAAKLSGARFVVLKSQLARLERAIGQFFINTHVDEHGLTEIAPPVLVNDAAMFGTAQLPKFKDDQFFGTSITVIESAQALMAIADQGVSAMERWFGLALKNYEIPHRKDERQVVFSDEATRLYRNMLTHGFDPSVAWSAYTRALEKLDISLAGVTPSPVSTSTTERRWLIPTSEVPLTNLVAQSILSEEELPMRLTALTPCFRAEAGSAGRDTRGMIRQHQFNKVEMVTICTPETSLDEQERMLACAQAVLKKLDLPHRVVTLCTGDMGFASARTFDIEVWLPGQNAYREISSVSTCTDFQARRMNARYRAKDAKAPRYVHTLNGSGVAVGRALVAILETYQNADGSVTVPDVLVPYMGGLTRIGG